MSLRKLIRHTRLLFEECLYKTRKLTQGGYERPLELTRLEERMLFSASAIAPVVAQVAEVGGSILADAAPINDVSVFHVPDQQLLDLVADSVLPSQAADQNGSAAADEQTLELVFLDSSVSNVDQLISNLESQSASDSSRTLEFVVLDSTKDGIAQITSALLQHNGVDGIHIVSQGDAGRVQLGSTLLSMDNLDRYRGVISAWQYSMSDKADVLFYGCNLAASEAGRQLMNEISVLTDTETSSSEGLTAAAASGGDLILDDHTGGIESAALLSPAVVSSRVDLPVSQPVAPSITVTEESPRTETVFVDPVFRTTNCCWRMCGHEPLWAWCWMSCRWTHTAMETRRSQTI